MDGPDIASYADIFGHMDNISNTLCGKCKFLCLYDGNFTEVTISILSWQIHDQDGLKFKQCSYNWWDHSLAIGEVLFLAWGIRVCYNVRNAESLYNEARLISYAIYNIALVNITMVAFQ